MPWSWDERATRSTFPGVRGGTNVKAPKNRGSMAVLMVALLFVCSPASRADGSASESESWEAMWTEWESKTLSSLGDQIADLIVVEELTVAGEVRQRREISPDSDLTSQRPRRRRSGELSEVFGTGGDPAGSVERAPALFFAYDWGERRYQQIDGVRAFAGVEANGVRVTGTKGFGEAWYNPETGALLLTILHPTGEETTTAAVRYRPVEATRVHSVVLETIDERGIFADRVRRMTITYE